MIPTKKVTIFAGSWLLLTTLSFRGTLGMDVCGVYSACIMYGVLELDVCGIHSICSVQAGHFFCGI